MIMCPTGGVRGFLCRNLQILFLCSQPTVCHSLLPLLPNHSSQWATFSLESSLLILLLLVLVFPEKLVFALGFNLINFYPWEDISCFILLLGLPLEIPGHSWRACVGPTTSQDQKSHLETYVAEAFPHLSVPREMECTEGSHFLLGQGFFLLLRPPDVKGKLSRGAALSSL